jgi:hypothetical protein
MSSKYEREIDEILRKFDDERPPTMRDRVSAMNRRPTPIRSARRPSLPTADTAFWLVVGFAIAFVAEIVRYGCRGLAERLDSRQSCPRCLVARHYAGSGRSGTEPPPFR